MNQAFLVSLSFAALASGMVVFATLHIGRADKPLMLPRLISTAIALVAMAHISCAVVYHTTFAMIADHLDVIGSLGGTALETARLNETAVERLSLSNIQLLGFIAGLIGGLVAVAISLNGTTYDFGRPSRLIRRIGTELVYQTKRWIGLRPVRPETITA